MRRPAVIVGLAVAMAVPSAASARKREGPLVIVPPKRDAKARRAERRSADLSQGGQRRGIVELTVGSIALGVAFVLVGRGAWELSRVNAARKQCEEDSIDFGCNMADPATGNYIAAGLSFGFALPLMIGGSIGIARGVRIQRDYRKFVREHPEVAVMPYGDRRGGGLGVRVRF